MLLDHLIRLAQGLLARHGHVVAFGAWLLRDGTIVDMLVEPPADESGFTHLVETQKIFASRGDAGAAGAVADLRLHEKVEGVAEALVVELDHRAPGQGVVRVILPYRRRRLRGFTFGELVGSVGETVFPV